VGEKDDYKFQRMRIVRLADEVGRKVELDGDGSSIKVRGANAGVDNSFDWTVAELAEMSDEWLRNLILGLAERLPPAAGK
jgi:hypothetical protein